MIRIFNYLWEKKDLKTLNLLGANFKPYSLAFFFFFSNYYSQACYMKKVLSPNLIINFFEAQFET